MGSVLVTGASGYAGGAIAAALLDAGMPCVIAGRRAGDDVSFDLTRPGEVDEATWPDGVEACVHAAAWNEVLCAADPVGAYEANVSASRALIAAALRAGVRRFVYVSTFHVYGRSAGLLDEAVPAAPANDYGLTHAMAETLFLTLAAQAGATVHVLRPANLYGVPGAWSTFDRWTLAPFDFVRQAVDNGAIVLRTDGSPVRSYVSLAHLGAAAVAALRGEVAPGIVHLAGRPWSMAELAKLAAQALSAQGQPVSLSFGNIRPAEAPCRFDSRAWPVEVDDDGGKMLAFLNDVARHLRAPAAPTAPSP